MDPLEIIKAEHSEQRRLCQYLEQIADQLPKPIAKTDIETICAILKHKLPSYHRNEEALYSLIEENNPGNQFVHKALALLINEHRTQQCFAYEFHELFCRADSDDSNESRGYLLRYFFETIAHHLDWEDALMIQLADNNLEKAALEKLAAKVSLNSAGLLPEPSFKPNGGK